MAVRKNSRKRRFKRGAGANLLGFALISGSVLFAAFLIKGDAVKNNQNESAPVVAQFDAVKVPVPVEPVSAGTKLSKVKFKQVSYPSHQIPEGALTDLAQYTDAVTLTRMPANLPVFSENLSFTDAVVSNPVIDQIPKGMRAMTIRVDATTAVEGWAGSGSVVDVLLVEKEKTTVVAESVKILSAERSVSPVEGESAPKPPTTVTMLVSQEQCLAINTAIPRGKIAFALRSTEDSEAWERTVFTGQSLRAGMGIAPMEESVSGVVTVKEDNTSRSFALAGGKWVPTEVVPEGFFVAGEVVR